MKLYCSKCRDELVHRIRREKNSKEDYMDISVIRKVKDDLYECICNRCKNTWLSKSKSARFELVPR